MGIIEPYKSFKIAIMELPTSNSKKVIDIWLAGLVAKNDSVTQMSITFFLL